MAGLRVGVAELLVDVYVGVYVGWLPERVDAELGAMKLMSIDVGALVCGFQLPGMPL